MMGYMKDEAKTAEVIDQMAISIKAEMARGSEFKQDIQVNH